MIVHGLTFSRAGLWFGSVRRALRPGLCVAVIACVCAAGIPTGVRAEPHFVSGDGLDKAQTDALVDELDDIDFVRSLTPLKLTGEQIDKLVTEITDAKTRYDKKIADLSNDTVGAMADEIHKRHKEAVAGGAVSETFDKKVKNMMTDFYSKRDKINTDNLVEMIGKVSKILTAEQQKQASTLEKNQMTKLGKIKESDTDAQYFNLYTLDIFVGYRRIVPLLKAIKQSG